MENHVATVNIGKPPTSYEGPNAALFLFHQFDTLPHTKGIFIQSEQVAILGRKWSLMLFPRGDITASNDNISIYLNHPFIGNIDVRFSIGVLDIDNEEAVTSRGSRVMNNEYWRVTNFMKRSEAIKHLRDGTLRVKLCIEKNDLPANMCPAFAPTNPFSSSMLNLLTKKDTADVVFEFHSNGAKKTNGRKKAKIASESLYAHRLILKECAPPLAALCESSEKVAVVPIKDESLEIFRLVLQFIYGGNIAPKDMRENAKSLIDAADKYGVINLKLDAEKWYVKDTTITVDNVIEHLLYADAKNCALLKEAVMDFIFVNGHKVLRKVSVKGVPGNMFADLLAAVARGKPESEAEKGGTKESPDYSIMKVNGLRALCQKKGLDVDGSRESLIAALERATKS